MIVATCSQFKNNFGKYLKVALKEGEVLIEKNGVIVAKLIAQSKSVSYYSDYIRGIGKVNNNESQDNV